MLNRQSKFYERPSLSYLLSLIRPFAIIILISVVASLIHKKRFGEVLPVTIAGTVLTVFVSGVLFGTFTIGYAIILIYPIVGVIKIVKDGRHSAESPIANIREYILTPAFVVCIIFSCTLAATTWHHGAGLVYWDEYAHWGQMTKELLRLNNFYITADTTLGYHNDYPPAPALLEAIWCTFAGGYDERIVYFSLQIFQISLFLPAVDCSARNLKVRSVISHGLLLTLAIFCITLLDFSFDDTVSCFYRSIYPDTMLAVLVGTSTYYVFAQADRSHWFYASTTMFLTMMILTKQIAILFVALICLAFIIGELILRSKERQRFNVHDAIGPIIVVVIPILCLYAWNLLFANSASAELATSQFHIGLDNIMSLPSIAQGSAGASYQQDSLGIFCNALVQRTLIKSANIPYIQMLILLFVIGASISFLFKDKRGLHMAVFLLIGGLCYAFIMMCLYCFSFNSTDAVTLASYERYMNMYCFAMLVAQFNLYIYYCNEDQPSPFCSDFYRLILIFLIPISISAYINSDNCFYQFSIDKSAVGNKTDKNAATLIESKTNPGDSIFVINQGKGESDNLWIAYYADGRKISRGGNNSFSSSSLADAKLSPADLSSLLETYDYIFFLHLDSGFTDTYSNSLEFEPSLQENTLYKVTSNNTKISFVAVN